MATELEVYYYVEAALAGIWVPPLFILWAISLFMVRRRGDPARVAFAWLKAIFPILIISIILVVVTDAVLILYENYEDDVGFWSTRYDEYYVRTLLLVQLRTVSLARFFERLASVLVFITFVELGNGFMYAHTHQRATYQQIFRYVALFFAAVLIAISIAWTAKYNEVWLPYYNDLEGYSTSRIAEQVRIYIRLSAAHDILYWILSLSTVGYAAASVHFWKNHAVIRKSAIIFLVATILNFIRYTYFLAYAATYSLPGLTRSVRVPTYIVIVEVVFNMVLFGVVLVLLFVIGVLRKTGLWTIPQHFHHGMAPAALPSYQPGMQQQPYQPPQAWQPAYAPQPSFAPQASYGQPATSGWQQQQPQQEYSYPVQQPQPPYQQQQDKAFGTAAPPPQPMTPENGPAQPPQVYANGNQANGQQVR